MENEPFMRSVMDTLRPRGAIHSPAPGGNLDRLLNGMADNAQADFEAVMDLSTLRNPWKCPESILPDLEREFGITPDTHLTIKDRRANLAVRRYKKRSASTIAKLQAALDRAGFGASGYGLTVIPNGSPATDPAAIVDSAYQLTAHAIGDGSGSVAGNASAYAAKRGGYYLVNGDQYSFAPIYPQAGQICARAFDGSDSNSGPQSAGSYQAYTQYSNEYASPPAGYWPMIFFIGGTMSRNGDGSISAISTVWLPSRRRQELHSLILRVKPWGMWAAMIVQYQ